jgi:hypothetical protein
MVHKCIICNPTHKTHHDPNLGGIHYFHYSTHYKQWWALCRNGKKSKKSGINFFQFFNFAKLWILQLCERIILTYKLQLKNIQRKNYNPWKELFNTILHVLIKRDLIWFLGFNGWESNCQFDFSAFLLCTMWTSNLQMKNANHFLYVHFVKTFIVI